MAKKHNATDSPMRGRNAAARPNVGVNSQGKQYWDKALALDANGERIALNAEGRLTGVPVNWSADCAKLSSSDFEGTVLFPLWEASWNAAKASHYAAEAANLRRLAKEKGLPEDSPERQAIKARRDLESVRGQLAAAMRGMGKTETEIATMLSASMPDPEEADRRKTSETLEALREHCRNSLSGCFGLESEDIDEWVAAMPDMRL